MISEINLDNINILDDSFINKESLFNEINNNPFGRVLVYIKDNKVLGYLYYSDIYDRIEINQIEVLEKFRCKGIASSLLEELIKQKKDITLEVRENNIPAIKLYEKFGFKKIAVRSKYYGNIDGILMERKYVVE